MNETPSPLFVNLNVSLFPDEILADETSFSMSQSTASPDESPPIVEPVDSSSIVPSSPSVPLSPSPLHRYSHVSQPSVLLFDYVYNSTIVTYERRTYRETSSNYLW